MQGLCFGYSFNKQRHRPIEQISSFNILLNWANYNNIKCDQSTADTIAKPVKQYQVN